MAELPPSSVDAVAFVLMGTREIRTQSALTVRTHEMYSGDVPVSNGVCDRHMGTTEHRYPCASCGQAKRTCYGHPGVIELAYPLMHPTAVRRIVQWLRIVCHACGALMDDPAAVRAIPHTKRLAALASRASAARTGTSKTVRTCPRCGTPHTPVSQAKRDPLVIVRGGNGGSARAAIAEGSVMQPHEIEAVLSRVSDEAAALIGGVPPQNMMLRAVPMPPVTIRPGVRSAPGAPTSYHDLTTVLQHLINTRLPDAPAPPARLPAAQMATVQAAQSILYNLIVGSSGASTSARALFIGQRQSQSLLGKQPKKKGRIRGNLLGCRTVQIARSTIAGDARLRHDELGMPITHARTMQIEMVVTETNYAECMRYFLNGRVLYPGSTRLTRAATGLMFDVGSPAMRNERLAVGDLLLRDVVDGDIAVFNRQPTLERSSMTGLRIVVKRNGDETYSFNPENCPLWNADYDGDSMTALIVAKDGLKAEILTLSFITNHVISTKSGTPAIGSLQDAIDGAAELTSAGARVDRRCAMEMWHAAGLFTAAAPAAMTGREVVSALFTRTPISMRRNASTGDTTFTKYAGLGDASDYKVIMDAGVLREGVLDKATIGPKRRNGLIALIAGEFGAGAALDASYALQQTALVFLMQRGFTVGLPDITLLDSLRQRVTGIVSAAMERANLLTGDLVAGKLTPPLGKTLYEHYEERMINALKPDEEPLLTALFQNVQRDNGLLAMIRYGAKGSVLNMVQICAVIGQQLLDGRRFVSPPNMIGRSSPYFRRCDTDPRAAGYVPSSYVTGQSLTDMLSGNKTARGDLIVKATSTALTGHEMRESMKSNESIIVDYHRACRKDTRIVQILYGDDGLDPRFVEYVEISLVLMSDVTTAGLFDIADKAAAPPAAGDACARLTARARALRDRLRTRMFKVAAATINRQFTADVPQPVHVARTLERVAPVKARLRDALSGPALADALAWFEDWLDRLPYIFTNPSIEARRLPLPDHYRAAVLCLEAQLLAALPVRVLATLTPAARGLLEGAVRTRMLRALIDPGAAVGSLAAQSNGEPITQYMLDAPKRPGGTSSAGITQIQDIVSARGTGEESRAEMLVRCVGAVETNAERTRALANEIEYLIVGQVAVGYRVLYEPTDALCVPQYVDDKAFIAEALAARPRGSALPQDITPWCVRIVIDRMAVVVKNVQIARITSRLRIALATSAFVISTTEAAPELVIRVWLRAPALAAGASAAAQQAAQDGSAALRFAQDSVLGCAIRGVPGVRSAKVEEMLERRVQPDGSLADAKVWVIRTVGTNLARIALHPLVEAERCVTTSIGDTYQMFGIDAARDRILRAFRHVLGDDAPEARHLAVISSEMSRPGMPTSFKRAGLQTREPDDVLLNMAHSSPVQSLTAAAYRQHSQRLVGISGPLMMGTVPKIGSHYTDLAVNEAFVRANTRSLSDVLDAL